MMAFIVRLVVALVAFVGTIPHGAADVVELKNDKITAVFDDLGLIRLSDNLHQESIELSDPSEQLILNGEEWAPSKDRLLDIKSTNRRVDFVYRADDGKVIVRYEIKPDSRFVSKQLLVDSKEDARIDEVTVAGAKFRVAPAKRDLLRGGSYGALLEFGAEEKRQGVYMVLQNPFCNMTVDDSGFAIKYSPKMHWPKERGIFESDRVCLGFYTPNGVTLPRHMLGEWDYRPDYEKWAEQVGGLEVNGILALRDCVKSYTTYKPDRSLRLHVDWCVNAYQLDLSKPGDWKEYQRIIQMASKLGCDHILYAANDSQLADQASNRDAWGWEQILWMNLGQKIRKGEFVPGKDPMPAAVTERINYAKKHGIEFVGYVYPTLPFMQDPDWTDWISRLEGSPKPGGYLGADTGKVTFQNWLVDNLIAFRKQSKLSGYSFDHWWVRYEEGMTDSSPYEQWKGNQQILLKLRERDPDIILDGRQEYHFLGPWTWLGGSFPHPMASDEQPVSFRAFPDLHTSRVSANRTRSRNYWYFLENYTPVELMPGFTTHQTTRFDANNVMRRDSYRKADWDYLGWKYSVISSIASAPFNHVINYIPARDEGEFNALSDADAEWHRSWLDWTDKHLDILKVSRPIIGQPAVGRCDGSAAIVDDRGFIFLFNPNYREMDAKFTLDESIGLTAGDRFELKLLYPDSEAGMQLGRSKGGLYQYGDLVSVPMRGASACVIELSPAGQEDSQPRLLNMLGQVKLFPNGDVLVSGATGEIGSTVDASVVLPKGYIAKQVSVNGVSSSSFKQDEGILELQVSFKGKRFGKLQQLGNYDPAFAETAFKSTIEIPERVSQQIQKRKQDWPVDYSEDDLKAPWIGPWRTLLFINIAEPTVDMDIKATLDGKPVKVLPAHTDVYGHAGNQTLAGWYIDLSEEVEAGMQYSFELKLPETLRPGQFQGVFVDNVEAEFTDQVSVP